MNDINKMPPKCQYCPYWEVCKYPWVCPDIGDKKPETHDKRTETHACDLISRQVAIDALDKRFDSIPMEQTTEILQLRKDLRELPSAQSEIIRCRECKWWDRCPSSTIAPLYHLCRRVGRMNMTADDFCSRAEQWEVSE